MSEKYDWRKLPVILKRYNFKQKLEWCSYYASLVCPDWCYRLETLQGKPHPFPWELNLIAMLSIAGTEYNTHVVTENTFKKFVNSIRDALPFENNDDPESVLLHYVMGFQLLYQTNVGILFSRYYYIFTHPSVRLDLIVEKILGVPYCQLLGLAVMSWAWSSNNRFIVKELENLCHNKNSSVTKKVLRVVSALSLDRKTFIAKQKEKIDLSKRGYLLADNLLEQFPFIRDKDSFLLPLPYLLKNAVSTGLLHRIASGENVDLRAKIGKDVLEDYVLEIMKYSGCYDFVSPEIVYHHNSKKSPDVLALKDDDCVLLEVKFKEPILKARTLYPCDEEDMDMMCAKAIEQVYRGIKEREEYIKDKLFHDENVFGLVVLFEEPNLSRARIFSNLVKEHPEWNNETIQYIKRHIRIVRLYDIEVLCFMHHDVIEVLKQYSKGEEQDLYNLPFSSRSIDSKENQIDILNFHNMLKYATRGFAEMTQNEENDY